MRGPITVSAASVRIGEDPGARGREGGVEVAAGQAEQVAAAGQLANREADAGHAASSAVATVSGAAMSSSYSAR